LKTEISKYNQTAKVFVSENKIANLIDLKEFLTKPQILQPDKKITTHRSPLTTYLAFCALGNPNAFFDQLRLEKFNLASIKAFPDHYFYNQNDIVELEKTAGQKNAKALLTTAKDAVKLKDLKFNLPCFVVESRLIFDNEESLRKLVEGTDFVSAPPNLI
jgi:tetraacyldisaccharide-1-P 4'-kinase